MSGLLALWFAVGFLSSVGCVFLYWWGGKNIELDDIIFVVLGTILTPYALCLLMKTVILTINNNNTTIIKGRNKDT